MTLKHGHGFGGFGRTPPPVRTQSMKCMTFNSIEYRDMECATSSGGFPVSNAMIIEFQYVARLGLG